MTRFYEDCPNCHKVVICECEYCEPLLKALKEITKGEGAFSQDRLTHATNTIENMKDIAQAALDSLEE